MNCAIVGGGRQAKVRGLCNMHYKRWRSGSDKLNVPGVARKPAVLEKHHTFYMAWTNMKSRCNNPNSTQYSWYGGRGIKVCERWNTFDNFYEDMFPSWAVGLELDREDNNKNYYKENCRWVTHKVNCQNRRPKRSWA